MSGAFTRATVRWSRRGGQSNEIGTGFPLFPIRSLSWLDTGIFRRVAEIPRDTDSRDFQQPTIREPRPSRAAFRSPRENLVNVYLDEKSCRWEKRNKGKSTPIRESRWLPEAGLMSSQLLSLGQRGCEQKPAEKFCLIRKLTASSIEETLSNCVPVCGKRRRRREKALICSSGPRDQELLRRSFAGKLTES